MPTFNLMTLYYLKTLFNLLRNERGNEMTCFKYLPLLDTE